MIYSQLLDRELSLSSFDEDFNPRLEILNIMEDMLINDQDMFHKQLELEYSEIDGDYVESINESSIIDAIKSFFGKIREMLGKLKDWIVGFFTKSSSSNKSKEKVIETKKEEVKEKMKEVPQDKKTDEMKKKEFEINLSDEEMIKRVKFEKPIKIFDIPNTAQLFDKYTAKIRQLTNGKIQTINTRYEDSITQDSDLLLEMIIGNDIESYNGMDAKSLQKIIYKKCIIEVESVPANLIKYYAEPEYFKSLTMTDLKSLLDATNKMESDCKKAMSMNYIGYERLANTQKYIKHLMTIILQLIDAHSQFVTKTFKDISDVYGKINNKRLDYMEYLAKEINNIMSS